VTGSLLDQANRTPLTFVVLLAYLAMAAVTDPFQPTTAKLVEFGASSGELVQHGEVWRLLTYAFLHGGLLHLAFNSYFLFMIGPALESALGSPRFAAVYLCSALGGGLGGCLWNDPQTPLVGGSGALFGIMGSALALNMRQGRHLLDFLNYGGPRQLVGLIAINLVIGMLLPMVSNAGHVGGLVVGFALTFCFLARGRDPADRIARAIQAGLIALLLSTTFYCVRPVTRWDFLIDQIQQADNPERARQLARALILRTDGLRGIPLTPEGVQLIRELAGN
jgi:membrane associated rhomboid family serine protease